MKKRILPLFLILVFATAAGAGCQKQEQQVKEKDQLPETICLAPSGETMTIDEAREISRNSECFEEGELSGNYFCNENSGTWWIDLNLAEPKPGCSPACVINVAEKTAEINWRCTGLIVPEE